MGDDVNISLCKLYQGRQGVCVCVCMEEVVGWGVGFNI